jgi:hypothetical protein
MGLIKLYAGRDGMDAHHLRVQLEQIGITAVVLGETLGSGRGDLPMTQETLPGVFVNKEDLKPALAFVRDYVSQQSAATRQDTPAWTCSGCGEQIEGQFDFCWQCETPRPNHER